MERPPSPCIRICTVDPARDLCRGCRRTLAEIAEWPGASAARQHAILAAAKAR